MVRSALTSAVAESRMNPPWAAITLAPNTHSQVIEYYPDSTGANVPRDAVQAYRYMQVSIQNETDEQLKTTRLKSLDDLAALMSPAQISRAKSLAATTEQP